MKTFPLIALVTALAGLSCCNLAAAEDRMIFSANGSTLTDTDGGYGGSVGLLHEVRAGTLLGVGVEHQTIADARWTFGTLRGALSGGDPAKVRWNLYADYSRGSGRIIDRSFTHQTATGSFGLTFQGGLTLQLEDRQIDIDTTHGNLPKFSASYLWNPRWLTTASYSKSVNGNLGTELVGGRIDYYTQGSSKMNWFVGGAGGKGSPAVFNLQTGFSQPGLTLKAAFLGFAKPFSRGELTVAADYLGLSGAFSETERVTLSVNYAIYLRARGQPR